MSQAEPAGVFKNPIRSTYSHTTTSIWYATVLKLLVGLVISPKNAYMTMISSFNV